MEYQYCTSVADLDPGSGAYLTPGSGIRDKHPGSATLTVHNGTVPPTALCLVQGVLRQSINFNPDQNPDLAF
jgi:hypothetical protein